MTPECPDGRRVASTKAEAGFVSGFVATTKCKRWRCSVCGPAKAAERRQHLESCLSGNDEVYVVRLDDESARSRWADRHSKASRRAKNSALDSCVSCDRVAIPHPAGGFSGVTVRRDKDGERVSSDEVLRLFDEFVLWRTENHCSAQLRFAGDSWSVRHSSTDKGKGDSRETPDILAMLNRCLERHAESEQLKRAIRAAGGRLRRRGRTWGLADLPLASVAGILLRLGSGYDSRLHAEWVGIVGANPTKRSLVDRRPLRCSLATFLSSHARAVRGGSPIGSAKTQTSALSHANAVTTVT